MSADLDALVIGAGPAGLMAAEAMAKAGRRVVVVEAKPSPARKFLMAGKSGLNLTKNEALAPFVNHYDADWLRPMLAAFGPQEVIAWAEGLGQDVFTGSTGRVFPKVMKGSPLLRAWLARLDAQGVELRTRWAWAGWHDRLWAFDTPQGRQLLSPKVVVLAMGGASWARLGSDGAWVGALRAKGVEITPWAPANMGFEVDWSNHMARHFGQPVKGAALIVDGIAHRGEFVISARGVEGGGIYAISRQMRLGASVMIDLLPNQNAEAIAAKWAKMKAGESLPNRLRKLGLSPVGVALLMEWAKGDISQIKALPLRHKGPRPLDEAISVAGGIARAALSDDLEIKSLPRVFAAGEMLDWEAPTGGYLLTACLATGLWAGLAAAKA